MPIVDAEHYTLAEAATLARITPKSLRARRYRGLPPRSVRVGSRVLYPIKEFRAWLEGREQVEPEPEPEPTPKPVPIDVARRRRKAPPRQQDEHGPDGAA